MPKKDTSFDQGLQSASHDRPGSELVGKYPDIYDPKYQSRRWWILGVRVDEERQIIPFHNHAFGGIAWQHGTQKQVLEDGWLGLDSHRLRLTRELLRDEQVIKCAKQIKNTIIRWKSRKSDTAQGPVMRWAADVLSLEHRIKVRDVKKQQFIPAGYRYHAGPGDVPVSSYLILIPKDMLDAHDSGGFFSPNLQAIPTMLDLDPSLIPTRMSEPGEDSVADEKW